MRWLYFASGAVFGLTTLSIAFGAVPRKGRVMEDSALVQNLSEIRVSKERGLNVDPEIERLNALEGRYRENLPALARVRAPMNRIETRKYRYTGSKRPAQRAGSSGSGH